MCITKRGVWVRTMMHACVCTRTTSWRSRSSVFQDVKAMSEHKIDISVISIVGEGKGTEAKIVK